MPNFLALTDLRSFEPRSCFLENEDEGSRLGGLSDPTGSILWPTRTGSHILAFILISSLSTRFRLSFSVPWPSKHVFFSFAYLVFYPTNRENKHDHANV